MGKRGPLAKPSGKGQGHRKRKLIALPGGEPVQAVPRAPAGMLPSTRRDWKTFWESPIASLVSDEQRPAVIRLFKMRDQHTRCMDVANESIVVKGSMGQIRVNPLADHALKLEGAILRLENELGLTLAARARLGIATGEAVKTMADLQDAFANAGDADADDNDDAEDPRIAAVQLADTDS